MLTEDIYLPEHFTINLKIMLFVHEKIFEHIIELSMIFEEKQ